MATMAPTATTLVDALVFGLIASSDALSWRPI